MSARMNWTAVSDDDFSAVWNAATSVADVAAAFGVNNSAVANQAYQRRRRGVPLKHIPRNRQRASLAERYWSKVHVTSDSECWKWTGAKTELGYGVLGRGGRGAGNARAHRVSYEIANGPIPDGLCVLHSCDNPECTNPRHLFLGDLADNSQDASKKGRVRNQRGTASPQPDFDPNLVRQLRLAGMPYSQLSAMFGRHENTLRAIVMDRSWK